MENEKKVAVRFVNKCSPYNAGEIAGFAPHEAQRLVDARLAVYLDAANVAVADVPEPPAHRMVEGPAVSKAATKAPAAKPKGAKR